MVSESLALSGLETRHRLRELFSGGVSAEKKRSSDGDGPFRRVTDGHWREKPPWEEEI